MSRILKIVSVERGYDPRGYAVVAFGGAGPMHVCALSEEIEAGRVIVPPSPGMFSALGLLTADLYHDYAHPVVRRLSDVDASALEDAYIGMEGDGSATLNSEGVSDSKIVFLRSADLRYLGQGYELSVDVPGRVDEDSLRLVASTFHARHREVYGYASPDEPVELVSLRVRAVGEITKPQLRPIDEIAENLTSGSRRVWYESTGWAETPVYQRGSARWNAPVLGPAVVEQYDATTVVYPGWSAETDGYGNIVMRRLPR